MCKIDENPKLIQLKQMRTMFLIRSRLESMGFELDEDGNIKDEGFHCSEFMGQWVEVDGEKTTTMIEGRYEYKLITCMVIVGGRFFEERRPALVKGEDAFMDENVYADMW